jgi:hypothetical protein
MSLPQSWIDFDTSTSKTVNKISSVNAKNNNSSNNINEDFNLDIDYIQTTTTALIREYLARKVFSNYIIIIMSKNLDSFS